jgi:hypothetical protein
MRRTIQVRARVMASAARVVVVAAAAAALVGPVALMEGPAVAQGEQTLGLAQPGEVGFQFIARIEQVSDVFDQAGYLTSLTGLDETGLFTNGTAIDSTEATARFTFFSSGKVLTRTVNSGVVVTSGTSDVTVYVNEAGGASFDDLASFKRGTAIAVYSSTWQDVVDVYSPGNGIATSVADLTQVSATGFSLSGSRYVLGRVGVSIRLTFVGQGTHVPPKATLVQGGTGTILSGSGTSSVQVIGSNATSGWAYVALAVAMVALVIAVAVALGGRRRQPGPSSG